MRSAAGRVLSFALVLVLVMSVVGLATSQTFINKTGKTVTGIKIEFSRSVLITRHDSVFPDQSPSGRSDEFTFSGTDLRNLGRFSITWMPSSGKVTDYEWIEKAQPAPKTPTTTAQQEEEFKLPDPNTPPILYGDDYPGPDEPKYQPGEDEQIWLTDLEGHGDIYDNDSIKINYASGFDVLQITKISVYRNGVYMRFLPEKFDVLTNAQMKTFDGNYHEHSSASSHTDHAIMGYEYKFKIITADHLWILKKTVKSGFHWRPKEIWAEIDSNWPISMSNLSYSDIVNFLKRIKQDGFTGISLDISYYMNTPFDNTVYILKTQDPEIADWGIRTCTLSELKEILKAATEAALEVHIRGVIYISKKYNDRHGGIFRQGWAAQPPDIHSFFQNYTSLWLDLIPILNTYNVKLITPFTEMDNLEKYPKLIKNMYTQLSREFTGEIGFEEGTANILNGSDVINDRRVYTESAFRAIVGTFTFWDWKDSQGRPMRIEYSCWSPELETHMDQRVSVMQKKFVKFWSPAVDYYCSTYHNNLQMFGEIGAYDVDGVGLGNAWYSLKLKRLDDQEVADIWFVYLKGAQGEKINSINVWQIPLGDLWPMNYPGDFFINTGLRQPESPAYRVITAIIKPEE